MELFTRSVLAKDTSIAKFIVEALVESGVEQARAGTILRERVYSKAESALGRWSGSGGLRMWIGAREGRRMAVFGDWLVCFESSASSCHFALLLNAANFGPRAEF